MRSASRPRVASSWARAVPMRTAVVDEEEDDEEDEYAAFQLHGGRKV